MRTALAALLLGAVLIPAAFTPAMSIPAAAAPSTAAPREVNQGYSIPVGGITDLGALPVLGSLGLELSELLGQ